MLGKAKKLPEKCFRFCISLPSFNIVFRESLCFHIYYSLLEERKNSAALTGGIDLSVDTLFEVKLVFITFLINSNNKYK